MKHLATLLLLLTPLAAAAQPTIDGVCSDTGYTSLGTYTQARGFGDWGLIELKATADGTNLYICLAGTAENNFNRVAIWVDVVQQTTGIASGTQLPSPGGFFNPTPTLDLPSTEYAFYVGHGNDPIEVYANAITYDGGAGTSSDTFLGGPFTPDGTPVTSAAAGFVGVQIAYQNPDNSLTQTGDQNVSDNSGAQGYEFSIPLTVLGATAANEVQLFAAYVNGGGDFFSSDVIPEVAGNGNNNFGGSPDFTAQAGTQATSTVALPVELTGFRAQRSGDAVTLAWTTASETNNAGFSVEMKSTGAFRSIGTVAGAGTTLEAQAYTFTTETLEPGTYTFRLKQTDYDGAFAYSPEIEVTVAPEGAFALSLPYPNPATEATHLTLTTDAARLVEVAVYDLLGRRVAELANGPMEAATSRALTLDTSVLPAGVYLVRASDGTATVTRRLSVLR